MRWSVWVLRGALLAGGLVFVYSIASARGGGPNVPAILGFALLALGFAASPVVTAARVRETAPLRPGRVDMRADGSFEFHPANEPRPALALYATDGAHDAPQEAHVVRAMRFAVADASAHVIASALRKSTRAATRALPGIGRVHAHAHAHEDGAHLVVRLDVRGAGASRAWADAAERAFKARFERSVPNRGASS